MEIVALSNRRMFCVLVGNAVIVFLLASGMFYAVFQSPSSVISVSVVSIEPEFEDPKTDPRGVYLPSNESVEYLQRCFDCDISDAVVETESNILRFPLNEAHVYPDCSKLRSFHDSRALLEEIFERYGSLWISYMGDSRIREPYHHQFSMITGQKYAYDGTLYHERRYYCCFDSLDPSQCFYRLHIRDFNGSVAHEISKQFAVTSDTGVRLLRKGFCSSWEWQTMSSDMLGAVIHNSNTDLAINPLAYIMDPGINNVGIQWQKMEMFQQGLAKLFDTLLNLKKKTPSIKIVIHGLAATNDQVCNRNGYLWHTMRWVDRLDPVLKDAVRPW
eukprot:CAMPEP_0184335166 /NCGR_PEP_ID=MMETSP1089-20130417/3786_1 /TAXON_ID=38269 ORGANISM="Gloeochaete wittrockiana, Strain SAG46.84" /NCGR_SAMPLE_ID=MMETSP1089 /ASSEMBLY_ACC=CAM_ASM_000445 /LENGTH=329 /DNA_ID=CAMNT_0026659705 /DNA_START=155 /DNA_END=1141 /DNA_ORIENTATION=+